MLMMVALSLWNNANAELGPYASTSSLQRNNNKQQQDNMSTRKQRKQREEKVILLRLPVLRTLNISSSAIGRTLGIAPTSHQHDLFEFDFKLKNKTPRNFCIPYPNRTNKTFACV